MATEILHLSFRLMTEKTFSHSMDSSLLISDVKALIETDSEISPENQRLIFKGQLLKDEYTLQSYGLESGNTIHVVGRVSPPPAPEAAVSADVDYPDNVAEPDSTSDNTQQNAENTPEGQTGSGPNSGRGFGLPMGIFMSPIYATISVSGPGNVSAGENAMEQVASQFFSGVVNSLLTSFNNGPTNPTNTPNSRPTSSASRSQDDELLVDLELSSSVLNRVARSVKRLNSSPSSPTPAPSNVVVSSEPLFNPNSGSHSSETFDSVGEFNNLASTTGNVDHGNFRSRPQDSSTIPTVVTINLDAGNQPEPENETSKSVNSSEYEEFEGCGGKVLLIDPEVLSSKLPWDSLKKLENVLFEHSDSELNSDDYPHQGFVVPEESDGVCENSEAEGPKVEEETESLRYENFMKKFHSYELLLNEIMRDYNLGDRSTQLDRFKQLSSAMAIKTRIDASLCALFSWMQNQMVSTERARQFASHMGWSTSSNANNNTTNSSETQANENQNNLPTGSFNDNTNTGNSYSNDDVNSHSHTNFFANANINTNNTTNNNSNNSNTNTFTRNIPGVGEVTVQLPATDSSAEGTRLVANNQGLLPNNPFNLTSNNPFSSTQSNGYSPFGSSDSSIIYYNRDDPQRPEVNSQQPTSGPSSTETDLNTSNHLDLIDRYRNNPDFASSMARVRQTKLSDSYHSS